MSLKRIFILRDVVNKARIKVSVKAILFDKISCEISVL